MQRRIQHRKPLAQVQQLAAQRISGSAADQRQTGGMVEHFNGRISDLIALTRFSSVAELQTNLKRYLATYKHSVPQRPLHHASPKRDSNAQDLARQEARIVRQTGLRPERT